MKRLSLITAVLVSGILGSTAVHGGPPVSASTSWLPPTPTPSISPTTLPPTTTPRPTLPPTTLPPTTAPRPTLPPTTLPPTTLPPPTVPPTTTPPPPNRCPAYPRSNPYSADVISTRGGTQCWTLVASGDSVTSAHNQWASGAPQLGQPCPNTTRGPAGTGNEPTFSYAFRTFHGVGKFAGGNHYNFARTGYSTTTMRFGVPGQVDACNNVWGKPTSPYGMVLATAAWEKSVQRKVSWVTTGGVNDTNWSTLIGEFVQCSFLQSVVSANITARGVGLISMTIAPNGVAPHTLNGTLADRQILDLLLSRGGTCSGAWNIPGIGRGPLPLYIVPQFDLPAVAPTISANISAMVAGAVAAKIDKVTWVGYYDISPALIQSTGIPTVAGLDPLLANWIRPKLGSFGVPAMFPLARSAVQATTLKANETALGNTICAAVAAGSAGAPAGSVSCTTWPMPGLVGAGDIQSTVKGGMPHPSAAGHAKLAAMVMRIV